MTAYDKEKYNDSDNANDHTGDDYGDDHSTGHGTSNPANLLEGRDTGQIILIVLVVLAIIASIVMLLASSTAALKIALLAALWAAVGGIFLVTRYRNQVRDREEEMDVRDELYHAELEKIRAQQSTSQALERLEGSSSIDMDVLAEIKAELASIREQIEELSGREFTYEPAALKAEARRIMEIEARAHAAEFQAAEREAQQNGFQHSNASYTSGYDSFSDLPSEDDVEFTQQSGGKPSADAIAGRLGSQPTYTRNDNPLAEFINEMNIDASEPAADKSAPAAAETLAAKPAETPASSTSAASFAAVTAGTETAKKKSKAKSKSGKKQEAAATAASAEDSQQDDKPKEFNTGSFQAVRWDAGGDDAAKAHAKHASGEEDEPRRGRRRSDSHREGSVSVAELLAAAKKRNKDS